MGEALSMRQSGNRQPLDDRLTDAIEPVAADEPRRPEMKLYHSPLSGHSHRARLFLALLGVDYEAVEVDLANGVHKAPAFLQLNRFGEVPVLEDNGSIIPDSNAILVYLAKKSGSAEWLPGRPVDCGTGSTMVVGCRRQGRLRPMRGSSRHRLRLPSSTRTRPSSGPMTSSRCLMPNWPRPPGSRGHPSQASRTLHSTATSIVRLRGMST